MQLAKHGALLILYFKLCTLSCAIWFNKIKAQICIIFKGKKTFYI